MQLRRFANVILVLCATFVMQSCGNGGNSDTSGSLTLNSPATLTNNTDGTYSVATSVTYTPPAGKVPNGVVIKIEETEIVGTNSIVSTSEHTLTDSNVINISFIVPQSTQSSTRVVINASIGDMSSQISSVVPALASVSATPIQFLSSDAAGISRTTTITGGIAPYTLISVNSTDITATLSGSTLTVTNLVAPATGTTPTAATATVTVGDSIGNTFDVQVVYFK